MMRRAKRGNVRKRLALACVIVVAVVLAGLSSEQPEGVEFGNAERNKWRVSVGPAFNFNLRSRLGSKTGRAVALASRFAVPQTTGSGTRQAALDRITGASDPNGVKRYEGDAWIDPQDASHSGRETWNFSVPSAAALIEDGQMTLRSASFSETQVSSSGAARHISSSDDFDTPGFNIEVSRELYHNPEWHFGVDASFGFSWFMRRNCFGGGGEIYRRTDTATTKSGHFTETFDISEFMDPDGDYPFHDGVLGAGTYAGPGPVLDLDTGRIAEVLEGATTRTDVHSFGAKLRGDYNEFEFIAALRPYYEPWEWLRLYGTLGLGMSYMRLSYREALKYNGVTYRNRHYTENDFDVYGVAGLGLQVNYRQMLLGADFNARPWADDVDFDSELLHGSISRGRWTFRCYLGFEF